MNIQEIQLKTDIELFKEDVFRGMFNFPGSKQYLDNALEIIFNKKIKNMVEENRSDSIIEEYDIVRESEIIKELDNYK